uniref:Uncharacterized protein n=1 Tax=Brassica oleracea TaxID=3712 RepID=A0A3P6GJH9_BRAOL|nr:unnamed protein product [Brassica oleracea]
MAKFGKLTKLIKKWPSFTRTTTQPPNPPPPWPPARSQNVTVIFNWSTSGSLGDLTCLVPTSSTIRLSKNYLIDHRDL